MKNIDLKRNKELRGKREKLIRRSMNLNTLLRQRIKMEIKSISLIIDIGRRGRMENGEMPWIFSEDKNLILIYVKYIKLVVNKNLSVWFFLALLC